MSSSTGRPVTAGGTGSDGAHRGVAQAIIAAALLVVVLNATIVNIALPSIQEDRHVEFTAASLTWVVNGYAVAFGGLLLLGGRAGDLFGRRRVFVAGIAVVAAASLLGGLARGEVQLVAARVLQGVGAALVLPTALSLVATTLPPGPPRGRTFAGVAVVSGAGAASGLVLGGLLTEISWRWTFFVNVPVGLALALLAPRFLAAPVRHRGHLGLPAALTGAAGPIILVYGLTQAAARGWGDPVTLGCLVAGVALPAVFLLLEARSPDALVPLRVLTQRDRATSYLAMLVVGAGLFAVVYLLGIYLQTVLGYSPVQAGVCFLPFVVGIGLAGRLAWFLVAGVDPRRICAPGALLAAAGLSWMARLDTDTSYLRGLLGPMIVMSVGLGLALVPLARTAVAGADPRDVTVASALLDTMQQLGGAIGVAALTAVATYAATNRATALTSMLTDQVASGEVTPGQVTAMQTAIGQDAFTAGATAAFTVGALMIFLSAVLIAVFLRVRHDQLPADQVRLSGYA